VLAYFFWRSGHLFGPRPRQRSDQSRAREARRPAINRGDLETHKNNKIMIKTQLRRLSPSLHPATPEQGPAMVTVSPAAMADQPVPLTAQAMATIPLKSRRDLLKLAIGASLAALFKPSNALAGAPAGYKLAFQANFRGYGGFANGWLPISEWGPLPPYVLGNELWAPEFISHCPDHRDNSLSTFSVTTASQGLTERMTWTPYQDSSGHWFTGALATVDPSGNGFHVAPPFYATVYMSLPTGRDVWPAFWMTTLNRLQSNQTTNSAEIDVIEAYGASSGNPNYIYTQEIHTAVRTPNGTQFGGSAGFIYNPNALSPYGNFYSVWVDPAGGLVHFFRESGTWNGQPAGDIQEIFACPFLADMQQDFYFLCDYALNDRSWTGQPWTAPSEMWVKGFWVWKP
jgi:hypothetical protein